MGYVPWDLGACFCGNEKPLLCMMCPVRRRCQPSIIMNASELSRGAHMFLLSWLIPQKHSI